MNTSSTSMFGASVTDSNADKLPETDDERLMFYTEVVVANLPSLIADLSSAKNTFFSFSEKLRNEVKQKSAFLQSIGRTLGNCINASKALQQRQKKLEQYEVQLVHAAPPRFISSEEAGQEQAGSSLTDESSANRNIMVLREEDLRPVREAERCYQEETDKFVALSREVNRIEDDFETAHNKCQEMTSYVQSIKWKYDELARKLKDTQLRRGILATLRGEREGRDDIGSTASAELEAVMAQCRSEELCIIQHSIDKAREEVDSRRHELHQRRERHEVELAAYQIAYKEEQAASLGLKDDVDYLRKHQYQLEVIAKHQQAQESSKNSLRKLVFQSFLRSSSESEDANKKLSPQQESEVNNDHLLVSVIAARISAMEDQRRDVCAIVAPIKNAYDTDAVRSAVARIKDILGPEIALDDEALQCAL